MGRHSLWASGGRWLSRSLGPCFLEVVPTSGGRFGDAGKARLQGARLPRLVKPHCQVYFQHDTILDVNRLGSLDSTEIRRACPVSRSFSFKLADVQAPQVVEAEFLPQGPIECRSRSVENGSHAFTCLPHHPANSIGDKGLAHGDGALALVAWPN